jgi:hypothetical protein
MARYRSLSLNASGAASLNSTVLADCGGSGAIELCFQYPEADIGRA